MKILIVEKSDRFFKSSTSKGNQTKWIKDGLYIKADTLGYESIAEALISELEGYIVGLNFVDYGLCEIHEGEETYYGCYSKDFRVENSYVDSFSRLLELYDKDIYNIMKKYSGKDLLEFVLSIIGDITGLGSELYDYVGKVLQLDAITLNEDRHLNNLALLKTNGVYSIPPIFDNGLGLLSDTNDYPLDKTISQLIRKVKSKPFNTDFLKQCNYMNTSPLIIDIKGFYEGLESKGVFFKEREYHRALAVLRRRLSELEGTVWLPKY